MAAARQQAEQGLESRLWATADALRGSPDYSDEAIELVLKQTEVFAEKWATGEAA